MKKIIFLLLFLGWAGLQTAQAQSVVLQTFEDFTTSIENTYGESVAISGTVHLSEVFNSKSGQATFHLNAQGSGVDSHGNKYQFNYKQNIQVSSSGDIVIAGKVQLISQGSEPNLSFDLILAISMDEAGNASLKIAAG